MIIVMESINKFSSNIHITLVLDKVKSRKQFLLSPVFPCDKTKGNTSYTVNTLRNISRIKGNKTITFGQLIVYCMRNMFLAKSFTQCGGEASPRLFSKNSKFSIFLDQQSEILYTLLLFMSKLRSTENHLLLLHIKLF